MRVAPSWTMVCAIVFSVLALSASGAVPAAAESGKDSAFALADRIGRSAIDCRGVERDRYGRLVAVCFKGSEDLNRWMVEQGWAVAYRRYSMDYVQAEEAARAAGRGLWSGSFDMPWDWRKTAR